MYSQGDREGRLAVMVLTLALLAHAGQSCCGSLYYNIPRHDDLYGETELGSIRKIDPEGISSILVSDLENPSGIAVDAAGNVYYGNIKRKPFHFELFRLSPDGITTDLGDVLYTSGGVSSFWSFDVAVGPSGDVFHNIPRHDDLYGNDELGSIRKIDPEGISSILVSDLENPSGIAVDAAGNVYYGNIKRKPFHFELFKLSPDGITTDFGDVLYTSGGVSSFWSFDVAVGQSGDIFYNIPSHDDLYGNYELGSVRKIDPDGISSILVSGLENPNGIAVDNIGNVYYGNIKRHPFHFELFRLSPDGIVTDLGDVLYTPGSVSFFWSFDIAVPEPATLVLFGLGGFVLTRRHGER